MTTITGGMQSGRISHTLHCPRCKFDWHTAASGSLDCPNCRVTYEVTAFDALIHPSTVRSSAGEALVASDEASCFYHPEKKAVVPCDACGRFLCALCDMDLGSNHFCPACLEKRRTSHSLAQLDNYRTSYPDLALLLALVPLVIWPVTIISAPAAICIGIMGWNKPPSLTGRKKRFRSVIAILFAFIQLCGWVALLIAISVQTSKLF